MLHLRLNRDRSNIGKLLPSTEKVGRKYHISAKIHRQVVRRLFRFRKILAKVGENNFRLLVLPNLEQSR